MNVRLCVMRVDMEINSLPMTAEFMRLKKLLRATGKRHGAIRSPGSSKWTSGVKLGQSHVNLRMAGSG